LPALGGRSEVDQPLLQFEKPKLADDSPYSKQTLNPGQEKKGRQPFRRALGNVPNLFEITGPGKELDMQ
jgi:hypothetical protein